MQRITHSPVQFEITEKTRNALEMAEQTEV